MTQQIHLKVDTREQSTDLWDAFDLLSIDKGFTFERTFLKVGDVACGDIVIERKEASDFVSSIMDGRLKEQSAKMCLNYEYKYLIVEGSPFRVKSNIHPNAILGQMTSLVTKYNIRLIFVEDTYQFAYVCHSIVQKHIAEQMFNPAEHDKLFYKVKDEDIVVAMVQQIPNLGYEKAKLVAKKYNNSLKDLVNNVSTEGLLQIDGIGDITAKNILKILH